MRTAAGDRGEEKTTKERTNWPVDPRTGMYGSSPDLLIYPEKGWIMAVVIGRKVPTSSDPTGMEPKGSFIGVWHITDNGDVPPRFKLGGPKSTLMRPRR